jgi:hypothetical protein
MDTNYGLNNSLEYFEFALDSYDTLNSYNGQSLNTDWPVFWLGRPLNNVAAIKVLEVQIPFSYYVYNTSNNTFTLTESAGGPAEKVTITPGNYSSTTMIAELETDLNAASYNGFNYTVTYNESTQKFTISNSSGSGTFSLGFGVAGVEIGNTDPRDYLGFGPTGFPGNTSNASQVLVAPYAAMVTGDNYIYVNSVTFGPQVAMYLPQGAENLGNGTLGPQIAKVPVNVQPGGIIYWQDPDPMKWFDLENQNNVAVIDLYLTLGNKSAQTPLQLNGQNFSIKLGILVNKMVHNDVLGGGAHNDRVFQRSVMRGGQFGRMF